MDASTRRQVRDRAEEQCEYCGLAEEDSYIPHHIEHLRPKQHGEDDSLSNLALACQACNLKKGPDLAGIDPENGTMTALVPHQRGANASKARSSGKLLLSHRNGIMHTWLAPAAS